jgi:ABC-2 type transport system ATP-binding protein
MTAIIGVEHLVKQYRKAKTPAVDDISFAVEPGEFFALLGPNGAGKTTTISILTTTLAKTSGHVTIAGYDLDTQAREIRAAVGIIFQKPSLDLNLTAEENIRFHVCLHGRYGYRPLYRLMPAAYRHKVEELAAMVGLGADLFKRMKTFSGGMQRKLEIIRSLMVEPAILFLDEPSAGLDALSRSNLWNHLREVRRTQQTTIFLTTHYLEEAEDADHVCIVNEGKLVLHATPWQMKQRLTNRYILVDAPEHERLAAELSRLGVPFNGNGAGFQIPYQEATPQTLIGRLQTPLSLLRVHEPSLEEAYVDLLAKGAA